MGQEPSDVSEVLNNLLSRGLNETEAQKQYEAEATFSKEFSDES
ncbi:hypothetical protein [Paenibacillus brasilensis]|uniref:Uncharacterized protein n=1 Tax=Paenibacillus brasilensis TaxID=128574 RepID=A0ABU0L441_9BACL|nr:hypothetical protein [Paenibacillus brasilensis]MDQ0496051.1 hypothetical protein [Paenibacillus brasilensis]